ncbi:MAG: hypothetical protein ACRCVI_00815 [Mycoplasmoidaceae bacterium]
MKKSELLLAFGGVTLAAVIVGTSIGVSAMNMINVLQAKDDAIKNQNNILQEQNQLIKDHNRWVSLSQKQWMFADQNGAGRIIYFYFPNVSQVEESEDQTAFIVWCRYINVNNVQLIGQPKIAKDAQSENFKKDWDFWSGYQEK